MPRNLLPGAPHRVVVAARGVCPRAERRVAAIADRRATSEEPHPTPDTNATPPLHVQWFDKTDPEPHIVFYEHDRLVQHIDDGAIAAVTDAIARHVAPGSELLDLMSSWVWHLPQADRAHHRGGAGSRQPAGQPTVRNRRPVRPP